MNSLFAGFSRVDITPSRGIGLSGYFVPRRAEGVLDPLYIRVLALGVGEKRVLLAAIDAALLCTHYTNDFRKALADATGVPVEAIFLHATHTHTSPYLDPVETAECGVAADAAQSEEIFAYQRFVMRRLVDGACEALEDLSPARMGTGVSRAANIAFIRRFRMKDGSVQTNPGVNNPNILAPIGEFDDRVSILRFDREGKKSITLMNYANHPDVVGGNLVSADWPGLSCTVLEQAIDTTHAILFNGAQGDVNHVNVHPTKGYLNDLFMDFDDVARGYGHAIHMARVIAGAVMQVWDKVEYTDVDRIDFVNESISIPSNMPTPEQLPEARRIVALHREGREGELPYEGMMLTTVVAEAERMLRLENGPEAFSMTLSAVAVGNVALFGIPGEPFNGIGRALKLAEGWDMVIPCCITNGYEGYFPMQDAYAEGGYEARSSVFGAGVAEKLIEKGQEMLAALH